MDLEIARSLADLVSVDAIVTSRGSILYANPSCKARTVSQLGWDKVEGRQLWELFEDDQGGEVKEWYEELRSRDDRFGRLVLRSRGEDAPEETESLIALRLEDRELVVIRTHDALPVMERVSELETMTLMFKNYLHDGGLGLIILQDEGDRQGLIRYISPEGAAILEREASEVEGLEFTAFMASDEQDGVLEWYRARRGGDHAEASRDIRFLNPAGEALLLDVVVGRTSWNSEPAIYCLFRDETSKKIMVDELRRFAQGFDMLTDTMVLADRDFNVIYINPTGLERSGYRIEDVLGKPAAMFSSTEEEGEVDPLELIQQLFENGTWSGERTAITKDGRKYPVDLAVTMTVDDRGDPEMIAAVSRDITERKEAEQNLLLARERAEFFTDLLSHDINNYIQGVIGYLDLIAQEDLDEDQRRHASRAMEQANRVSQLIERVRTISKAQDAGELKPIDLGAVVDEAILDMTQKYSDRTCDMTLDGLEGPTMVMADELLRDLVINLLDNAIKYSRHPEAPVEVGLDRHPTMGDEYVLLSVADHGPGIPDENKTSIFYRFVRKVDDAEGSGLGLSLVNALTERYGGRVWVEDRTKGKPGEGARFIVELPVA